MFDPCVAADGLARGILRKATSCGQPGREANASEVKDENEKIRLGSNQGSQLEVRGGMVGTGGSAGVALSSNVFARSVA